MKYTVDYFIQKFEAIPEDKWTTGTFMNTVLKNRCALGHTLSANTILLLDKYGVNESGGCNYPISEKDKAPGGIFHEAYCLSILFNESGRIGSEMVIVINNGADPRYKQPTPQQRILAALHDIKKLQQSQHEDITKELAVLPIDETADIKNTPVLS
jgi:hypothetical protein